MDEVAPMAELGALAVDEVLRLVNGSLYPDGVFPDDAVLPMAYGQASNWAYHPRWDDLDGQAAFCAEHGTTSLYRVASPVRAGIPPRTRGQAADVTMSCALWADIDDTRGVHAEGAVPDPSLEQAWEVLRRYPAPPTGVIDTGGGLQAWWATTAYDPRSSQGAALRQSHVLALKAVHEALGVAYDQSVPNSEAPVVRVPAGRNNKKRPAPGGRMSEERLALVRLDIETAPVSLVYFKAGLRYDLEQLAAIIDGSGLAATRRTLSATRHVCGGRRPSERICATLPMSRVCKEMQFVESSGRLIRWRADFEDDEDGHELHWEHEPDKSHAKLWYQPPSGHDDMAPVASITCWGNNTAEIFGAEPNKGRICTWRWLRNGYFRDWETAKNFVDHYAEHPDEAMGVLSSHPRAEDLLCDVPAIVLPRVTTALPSTPNRQTAPNNPLGRSIVSPWAYRRTRTSADLKVWLDRHSTDAYGLAAGNGKIAVAVDEENMISLPLTTGCANVLAEAMAVSMGRGARWWSNDASRLARYVAEITGVRLGPVLATLPMFRAVEPDSADNLTDDDLELEAAHAPELGWSLIAMDKALALRACGDDRLWRHLAVDGIAVDVGALAEGLDGLAAGLRPKAAELLRHAGEDGRVRPIVEPYAEVTGRTKVKEPALQNVHPALRKFLLADDGCVLVGADFNQVEPRVAAGLSGDAEMITAAGNGDLYVAAAKAMWPGQTITVKMRSIAKRVLLAQIYGRGIRGLANDLGLTTDQARSMASGLSAKWPGMYQWAHDLARVNERLLTVAGRLLPTPPKPYMAVNWVVQGSAADVFYSCTRKVAKSLPAGARLWLPLHDELIVECRRTDADEMKALMLSEMRSNVGGVAIEATATIYGPAWSLEKVAV